mgnify:CR=1 FL=1
MGVILGIDIGGSSTKIVGLHENGTVIDMLRVKAEDPLTSLYGALGNFLATHSLKLTDIGHIALTGVGASYVDGDIYGVRTIKVEEFPSVGVGGLALSRKERAVVVSMGTGTSLLWAEKGGEIRHIIGSGIGGGTLLMVWMTGVAALPQQTAQGINLLYFLPSAACALFFHIRNRLIRWDIVLPAALGGCVTAAIAAWIATGLDVSLLRRLFGGFLLLTGLRELFFRQQRDKNAR